MKYLHTILVAASVSIAFGVPAKAIVDEAVEDERVRQTIDDLYSLRQAAILYKSVRGKWPRELADLLRPIPGHTDGVYGLGAIPVDPWGNDYIYKPGYYVMTYGRDGARFGRGYNFDYSISLD